LNALDELNARLVGDRVEDRCGAGGRVDVIVLGAEVPARCERKQGDKEGAIAAAKKSSEMAVKVEGANSSFVKMNDDLISSLQ